MMQYLDIGTWEHTGLKSTQGPSSSNNKEFEKVEGLASIIRGKAGTNEERAIEGDLLDGSDQQQYGQRAPGRVGRSLKRA
jgi:hypothetical protein